MGKGTDLEKRTEKVLEGMGYTVHRTHNSPPIFSRGRWLSSGDNDILGCFDCLAVGPDRAPRLVQSTTLDHVSHRRHKVDERLPIQPGGTRVEVWGWHKVKARWAVRVWRRAGRGEWMELEGME
jgi:hypothetical protein